MKMPEQAERVFSGEIFEVYQWQQEMFDGTFETFEMLKRPNTLKVLPIIGDKILIAKEEQPVRGVFYTFLGGLQEPNETPEEGIKRELLEEAGMTANIWEFLKTYDPATKMDWQVHTFIARDLQKVQEPQLESGERIEVHELSFSEFLDLMHSDEFKGKEFQLDILKRMRSKEAITQFENILFAKN